MLSRKVTNVIKARVVNSQQREVLVDDAVYEAHFVSILKTGEPAEKHVFIKDLDGHGDFSLIVSSDYTDEETGAEVFRRSSSMDFLTFAELMMEWFIDESISDLHAMDYDSND